MVYLDNAATTKPSEMALKKAELAMRDSWFNPSSLYSVSRKVSQEIKSARSKIKEIVGLPYIVFTSGSTEGNNTILKQKWDCIITTKLEHSSVKNTVKRASKVLYVECDNKGRVTLESLQDVIHHSFGKVLVSIIAVNNEIGTIQNIKEISKLIENYPNVYLHLDTTQCMGKIMIDYTYADYITASAHKFHGIKGVGFIASKYKIDPFITGGHQENEMRAGTENVPGILSMAVALEECIEHIDDRFQKVKELRDYLKHKLGMIPYILFNSDNDNPYILSVSFKDVNAESLLYYLSINKIYVSSGSACNSKDANVSDVLTNIHVPEEYINGTIRFSFSHENTLEEMNIVAEYVTRGVKIIRESM